MEGARVSRRELLAAGAAAGAALSFPRTARGLAEPTWQRSLDFGSLAAGDHWPGWACRGVANVRRSGGLGLLEAGSDVFPCDPRPVAFAVDQRFRDGAIEAVIAKAGAGAGVVIRRTGPRDYYAAVYDDERAALLIVRRSPAGVHELAQLPVVRPTSSFHLSLSATGSHPTVLVAKLVNGVLPLEVQAQDASAPLQGPGDPGVLATARTLFPSQGPPVLPALGNLHLLPYGVQEGEAVIGTPVGQQVMATIRERSTASFSSISVRASGHPQTTRPSVIAATNGEPLSHGAALRVASDVPAHVEIEIASHPSFRGSRRLRAGRTDHFESVIAGALQLRPGRRVYWRPHLRRGASRSVGPVRSFRVLPPAGSNAAATIAVGACASQFGPIFGRIIDRHPDAFVWQGDLNYPDTIGPLAQSVPGYAGIWRDFLANPTTAPLFERALFAAQRDDHDYGTQDANSTDFKPWAIGPWDSLMQRRMYYRFSVGVADVWVLDQRRHKTDPQAPDTKAKTLLGSTQRKWLMRTLAASRAPFKVICSPCTVAPVSGNRRDGDWAAGFTAERDLLLSHIRKHVHGRTIFITGDTHWTMVYDRNGLFEARPCPLDIPTPNDITIASPNAAADARKKPGVAYADDQKGHVAFFTVSGHRRTARLDLSLMREDGAVPFRRRFEQRR